MHWASRGANGVASGLIDTLTGSAIVLVNNAGVIEGHVATAGGALAFTVTADGSGNVTLDQLRAVVHTTSSNPDTSEAATLSADNLVTLTATVTDKDGDHTSATANIGQNLSFLDDGPTLGVVQSQQTNNDPTQTPAIGTLHFTPGADGAGSAMTITANVTGLKSGGFNLVTAQSGNVLTAYQDTNGDGIHQVGESTAVFTITVNPTAGTSGQYVFDLINPLDPTVTETAIGGSSSFGAGPTAQGQVLDNVAGTQHLAVVSGYHMGGTFNETTWLSTGSGGPTSNYHTAGVNGSTAGWGIDNNNFNGTDEMFVWDFGSQALRDPDGAGPVATNYAPPAGVVLPDISTATFDLIGYGFPGDDITYVVHYTDGTFTSDHIPAVDINDGSWKFTAAAGKFIADIEMFTSGTGSGKVDLTSVGVQNSTLDVTIPATVTLTDGDGDPTGTGAFNVHVQTGLVPFAPAASGRARPQRRRRALPRRRRRALPTTMAMARLPRPGSARMTASWSTTPTTTAPSTMPPSSCSAQRPGTDLQALAAQMAPRRSMPVDADFGKFAVWQDANSNGVVDAGELQSLTARGITSISLSSDGIAYSAAGGDVQVAGTGTYTNADGSTGSLPMRRS